MSYLKNKLKFRWKQLSKNISKIAPDYRDEFMDNELTNAAKKAMDLKLEQKRMDGRGGWWSTDCDTQVLKDMLRDHVEKGDMSDVMNLAAMIYYREAAEIESLPQ